MDPAFFDRSVVDVARALVGATLMVDGVGGVIVETEAYHAGDPAAHSYGGRTPRNAAMFGPPGHAYVYRSYGLHWCMNVVGGAEEAAAVLVRALEPTLGLDVMTARRGTGESRLLCAGPGRLCQALGITGAMNDVPLDEPPFALVPAKVEPVLLVGPRVGISRAVDEPWRFGLAGSRFLSRPFR